MSYKFQVGDLVEVGCKGPLGLIIDRHLETRQGYPMDLYTILSTKGGTECQKFGCILKKIDERNAK